MRSAHSIDREGSDPTDILFPKIPLKFVDHVLRTNPAAVLLEVEQPPAQPLERL